ncbi:hypothetical protein [Pontibacter sp. G13]|uniref:hypothetical protein n=1 Tax=Pontibacter sp. G13 TaxID=3074898 RepID=UPI00288C4162|nr:hypothetical protein [Pontibacter sp. G13]WNJ16106.1 hypothetical protein RJD25_14685 [Pontibacter sp. G13]
MRIRIAMFLVCMGLALPWGMSQQTLTIRHARKGKELTFALGDFIRIQGRDRVTRYSGYLESLEDTALILFRNVEQQEQDASDRMYRIAIPYSQIRAIYNPKSTKWTKFKHQFSAGTMVAGGTIIGGTVVNTLVFENPPEPVALLLATGILTCGFVVRYIGRDKYKIGKKWKLQVRGESLPLDSLESSR